MHKKMKRFFAIFLTLLSFTALADLPVLKVDIKSVDEESGKGLEGTTVEIYSEEKLLFNVKTIKNGTIETIELPINQVYKIYFKQDGYVTKMAEINAHSDRPSDLAKTTVVLMQVTMFKKVESVDLSFMETTPIIKYKFDSKGWMTFDRKYTEAKIEEINEIRGIAKN
jgi:hypothetical protein